MANDKRVQYAVSVILSGTIRTFYFKDFAKNTITFGRDTNNDIVLDSPVVSANHGCFYLENDVLTIYDNQSLNGFIINKFIQKSNFVLHDGDVIKIDNPNVPLCEGVLMFVTISNKKNKCRWNNKKYTNNREFRQLQHIA